MSSWVSVALSDVADVLNGKTPSKAEQRNEGHPVLKIRDVSELGRFRGKHESFVDPSLAARYSTKNVRDGDTLILNAAHNADYVGSKTYKAEPPVFGTLATGEWLIIRPDNSKLDANFVHHWVTSKSTRSAIRNVVNGIHLYPKDVARLEISLPPLLEQRRIAAILDQADALRAKRRDALAQLDSLTQSIFIEMFGDPVENPNSWQSVQLSDVSDIVTGFAFKSEEYVDSSDSSIKLCRGANVLPGRLDWSDLASWPVSRTEQVSPFRLQTGDIVMAMDRPWISEGFKVAQISKNDCPSLLVQRVARLRGTGEVSNDYIYHLLNHPAFTAHCRPTETTIPYISPREIRSFRFHLPPVPLQREFVNRVSCLNHLKSSQDESLKELDSLFASIRHRAFQGEL